MPGLVERVDDLQRRRRVLGVPLGVVYKFFDDQGNYLSAILTYYAFIAIFPLLLIASSVLGFLLQGDEELRNTVLDSALGQFPIVGTQLGRAEGLQGSTSAVVIGSLTALYGVIGLGQAAQHALNTTWAVPRNSRLNPVVSRIRSVLLMVLAGAGVLVLAIVTSVVPNLGFLGPEADAEVTWLVRIAVVAVTAVLMSGLLAFGTSDKHRFKTVLPGGVFIAVGWHLLQTLGGAYVNRVVSRASEINGVFALVLGLVALIYIAGVIAVLGMEINVVLRRRLYPRALLTPFTDAVQLTEADQRVYTDYARAQRHKGFETVHVTFDPDHTGSQDAV